MEGNFCGLLLIALACSVLLYFAIIVAALRESGSSV